MNDLDKLFSPSQWARLPPQEVISYHLKFIENKSLSAIRKIQSEINIAYGSSDRQKIDILGTDLPDESPICVFIHGGFFALREIERFSYHYIAENLYRNKIKTIFIGYDVCPDVTIPEITHQIESATLKCLHYAKITKSKALYFMGHSVGAHLIAFLFTRFIKSISEEDFIIKGVILTSGLYDLSLIPKTTINKPLKLDEQVALEMSPLKKELIDVGTRFYVIVGEIESPEFIKQSKEFYKKLQTLGFQSEFYKILNVDHFNILENLIDENFELSKLIIKITQKN